MTQAITTVLISREHDVVLARQRTRQVASLLGLDGQDQVRVATAVSELARNAFQYAGGGKIEYLVTADPESLLLVRISDRGPGIANLDDVLAGRYESKTGMGLGILGARRLMDRFEIESTPSAGTTVVVAKRLNQAVPSNAAVVRIADALAREVIEGPIGELQLQNQELMRALDEIQARQQELAQLNRELEETNRGVVALYAELDQRAEELQRASEAKSRFLSSVSHELRTPLSSTLALCDLLLARTDGPLREEQERQVKYVRAGAESLLTLVNDLLDLARIEAGKTTVDPKTFEIDDLFSALRGMFRPLHRNNRVVLVIEAAHDLGPIHTDEPKVSQILRNLVSNALRFTEEGDVRVRARIERDLGRVIFSVADTGIGIDPEDCARIFEEFEQVEGPLQTATKGTGLGLAVSRRLAALLGGELEVDSRPGAGSTFTLSLPLAHTDPADKARFSADGAGQPASLEHETATLKSALVIDDDEPARYLAAHILRSLGFRVVEANDGTSGLRYAREQPPDVIVLDLRMPGLDGFAVLEELRSEPATAETPVVINTAKPLTPRDRTRLKSAAAILDKRGSSHGELAAILQRLAGLTLSTSGRTLTIEESMTLRARTENAAQGDEREWSRGSG